MIKEELVYELVIGDESDEVYAVSLVSQPAIELGWVAFDKEEVKFQKIDDDKQLVLGPILIPNKRILRVDGEGNTYHVFLKESTIEQLAQKYLKNKYTDAVTVEHEQRVDDVVLVESWIVESTIKDKSSLYGFAVPKGTWMGVMKINSEEIWEDVKNGTYQGFSIEGLFSHQLVQAAKVELDLMDKEISDLSEQEATILLKKIRAVISKDKRYKKKERIDLAQPSIPGSSYAGEPASGSIAPATFGDVPPILQDFAECPEATQNVAVNLYNRQIAVKQANYGPLNPEEPNEEYWKAKAGQFEGDVEAAKKALCGNCAFFYRTKEILDCIAEGLGSEVDPYDAIEAGGIGYCDAFDFKCAAQRTCSAWVTGGPIV